MALSADVLERLMAIIDDRRQNPPPRSYTTTLFQGGPAKIGEKILEEAGEVVEAATHMQTAEQRDDLIHEAADLIYHLLVMLGYHHIRLVEVTDELARRFGTSGLDEKQSRSTRESS